MTETPEQKREIVATLRDDFMRRWFAIAISVGFATTVANMEWVRSGSWPDASEQNQLMRLAAAVLATVLSWEGYLQSIRTKKLYDIWRFLIDVFLVFVYLFLLITSKFETFWLLLHAGTFTIYVLWDAITIAQYRSRGWFDGTESGKPTLASIYLRAIASTKRADRGPIITAIWCLYFWLLYWQYPGHLSHSTMWFAIFVVLGLAGYRLDKSTYRTKIWFTPASVGTLGAVVLIVTRHGW